MHPSALNQGPGLHQSHQYYRYSDSLIIPEPLRRVLLTQGAGSPVADYSSHYNIHPSASSSSSSSSSIPNNNHVNDPEQTRPNSPAYINNSSGFDINIVIITAAILFLLLSALAMNCVVKCMLRRCSFMFSCYGAFPSAPNQESGHNNHPTHEAGMKKKEIKALPSIVYRDGARNSNSNNNHHHHHHHHHHYNHSHDNHGCHDHHHDQHKDTRGDGQEEDGSCPICLADYKDGDRIRVLPPCRHRFHMSCIDMWLVKHSSCPTCRGQLMGSMEAERPHVQLQILITTPTPTPSLTNSQVPHKDGFVSS